MLSHKVQTLFAAAFPLHVGAAVTVAETAPQVAHAASNGGNLAHVAIIASSLASIFSVVGAVIARRFPSARKPRKRRAKPAAKGGEI